MADLRAPLTKGEKRLLKYAAVTGLVVTALSLLLWWVAYTAAFSAGSL